MQGTGIVRRIDELGRVVIPKEMRKTLRIKEGDPLEIFANHDELIFTKYSPVSSCGEITKTVADSIGELTEQCCVMTDTDSVIYASDNKCKDMVGKKISNKLTQVLGERKSVIISREDGGDAVQFIEREEVDFNSQVIVPIIANGDCFGSIILINKDKDKKFTNDEVRIVRLGEKIMARQFM